MKPTLNSILLFFDQPCCQVVHLLKTELSKYLFAMVIPTTDNGRQLIIKVALKSSKHGRPQVLQNKYLGPTFMYCNEQRSTCVSKQATQTSTRWSTRPFSPSAPTVLREQWLLQQQRQQKRELGAFRPWRQQQRQEPIVSRPQKQQQEPRLLRPMVDHRATNSSVTPWMWTNSPDSGTRPATTAATISNSSNNSGNATPLNRPRQHRQCP